MLQRQWPFSWHFPCCCYLQILQTTTFNIKKSNQNQEDQDTQCVTFCSFVRSHKSCIFTSSDTIAGQPSHVLCFLGRCIPRCNQVTHTNFLIEHLYRNSQALIMWLNPAWMNRIMHETQRQQSLLLHIADHHRFIWTIRSSLVLYNLTLFVTVAWLTSSVFTWWTSWFDCHN